MNIKASLSTLALSVAVLAPASAMAEVSANIGWNSEYIFRGIFQKNSSAFAGVDYSSDNGFYIGTWGADVGDGLETDLYFGWGGGDDFTYSFGYTGYFYTDNFDDTYQEANIGIGYGIFALDLAIGQWDGFGNKQDYTFTSVTISPEKGPYFKIGSFSQDFDGDYFEMGYTYTMEDPGVDLSVAAIRGKDPIAEDWNLTFSITKNIAIGN